MKNILKQSGNAVRKYIQVLQRPSRGQKPDEPLFLNEAVNFEKQVIFIAVPKAGTTTVRSQIKQQGVAMLPTPHLNIIQVRDLLYLYFLKNALGKNTTFPSDSVPTDADLRAEAQKVFASFFKFASVRNPWARAVSLYFRGEGVRVQEQMSFEQFCERHMYASDTCRMPTLHKNQLDWLCDENGQCLMDYVYRIEDFEQAIREIENLTQGRLRITKTLKNVNPKSPSKIYQQLYSDRTRQIIAQRFEKDIDYFKYVF